MYGIMCMLYFQLLIFVDTFVRTFHLTLMGGSSGGLREYDPSWNGSDWGERENIINTINTKKNGIFMSEDR